MNPTTIFSLRLRWLSSNYHAFFGAAVFLIILGFSGTAAFASSITGLDFPGNTGVTVRFRFLNPLSIYPATYIWRAYPRAQPPNWPTSQPYYYTTFFWGNDDGNDNNQTFLWNNGSADTYYGAHPYPQGTPPNFVAPYTEKWEIATDGYDFTSDQSVVFGQWYTQAFVAWADENGYKHTAFYWDLSDPSKVVTHISYPSYGNLNPPVPALTFGDAPWDQGWEVYTGILRGIRVYSTNLSLSDILSEANSPLSTSAGMANVWYLNMNPTPGDILDKSGAGHNPKWVGDARPSLYSDTDSTPPPADNTSPMTTSSLSGQQGTNGWYNGPVTVTLIATDIDGPSDIVATRYQTDGGLTTDYAGPFIVSSDGTHTIQFSSTDRAGNIETPSPSVTFKIDKTPPSVQAAALPSANPNGWNNTNVTVSFTGTDAGSGIDFCAGLITLIGDGAGQSASGTCTDKAGNVSTPATITGINIDKTPPTLGFVAPSPAPNPAGWNNTNISIAFTPADRPSGVASTSLSSPLSLTTEGAFVSGTVTVTDKAGNSATFTSPTVKIDKTPPALTAQSTPLPNANGWNNTSVTTSFPAADALSGLRTVSGPIITTTEGAAQPVTGTATDLAGNLSSMTVLLSIDKTAPEAYNQFDAVTKTLQVFGRDALSGVPSGPVTKSCLATTWGSDDGDNDQHAATADGNGGDHHDDPNAQLCNYTITDLAGNKLVLIEKLKQQTGDDDQGRELKVRVISTQYNNGSAVTAPFNQQDFQWSLNKNGSLKSFDQTIVVGQSKNRHQVDAKFDPKKNQTTIQVQDNSQNGNGGDQSKDDKDKKTVMPGLDLLRMVTHAGLLDIEFYLKKGFGPS